MNFSFHPEADEEFVEGVAYYEDCEPGLGLDFSREVYATIQNVLDYPTCGRKSTRRFTAASFTVSRTVYCTASSRMAYSSSPSCTCIATRITGNID